MSWAQFVKNQNPKNEHNEQGNGFWKYCEEISRSGLGDAKVVENMQLIFTSWRKDMSIDQTLSLLGFGVASIGNPVQNRVLTKYN